MTYNRCLSENAFQVSTVKKIEEENVRLRKDVEFLKECMCDLERKNGGSLL